MYENMMNDGHPSFLYLQRRIYSRLLQCHGVVQNTITVESLKFVNAKFRVCKEKMYFRGYVTQS